MHILPIVNKLLTCADLVRKCGITQNFMERDDKDYLEDLVEKLSRALDNVNIKLKELNHKALERQEGGYANGGQPCTKE